MKLFPMGDLSASLNTGSLNGINYSFFEPNAGCKGTTQYNNLISSFENQTISTRKKALNYLTIEYTYDGIFAREYNQIEHFIDSVGGRLDPFYLVNLDKGIKMTNLTVASTTWICNMPNTLSFSNTMNYKANYGFFWDGSRFKVGVVSTITSNVSVTFEMASLNYGTLPSGTAKANGMVYPMYQVYSTVDTLDNFNVGSYVDGKLNNSSDIGYMRSGNILFVSKYGV
jgi:hypothetical protein